MIQELKDNYGHLFEDELLEEISRVGTFKEVPEGYKLMEIGQYIKSMPLLIDGAIKIMRDDTGLYPLRSEVRLLYGRTIPCGASMEHHSIVS